MDVDTANKESSPMKNFQVALEESSLSEKSIQQSIQSQQDSNSFESQPTPLLTDQDTQPISDISVLIKSNSEITNTEVAEELPATMIQIDATNKQNEQEHSKILAEALTGAIQKDAIQKTPTLIIQHEENVQKTQDEQRSMEETSIISIQKEERQSVREVESKIGDAIESRSKDEEQRSDQVETSKSEEEEESRDKKEHSVINLEIDLADTNGDELMEESHLIATNNIVDDASMDEACATTAVESGEAVSDWDDTNLYCSTCIKPFTVENFFNHLTTTHQIQPEQLASSSRFSVPGLIPKNYCKSIDLHTSSLDLTAPIVSQVISSCSDKQANFTCNKCGYQCDTRRSYWKHFSSTHKISIGRSVVNPDVLPDPDDPNFYCRSCEKYFTKRTAFNIHLRRVHAIVKDISRLLEENYKNPTAIPDPDDPNLFCTICEEEFLKRKNYHVHISYVHFISTGAIGVPAFPCGVCNVAYIREDFLQKHMLINHGMELVLNNDHEASSTSAPSTSINADSSSASSSFINNMRYAVASYSSQKYTLEQQKKQGMTATLKLISKQPLRRNFSKVILHPEIIPDENDPSFYCHACEKHYSSRLSLRLHIVRIHKIGLKPLLPPKVIANPDVIPDEDDPNNYCAACELTFSTRLSYRSHLKFKHGMITNSNKPGTKRYSRHGACSKLAPDSGRKMALRMNSHVVPNEADPNMYCAQCDKRYATRLLYRIHLGRQHHFIFDKRQSRKKYEDPDGEYRYSQRGRRIERLEDAISCQVCHRMTFYSTKTYDTHLQQAHGKVLAPFSTMNDFSCNMCHRVLASKAVLANHLLADHNVKAEPNFPPRTATATNLVNDDTPPQPKSLKANIPAAEAEKSEELKMMKKECDICGKVFNNKYSLGAHRESTHNILFVYDDESLYCNLCTTYYNTERGYDNHLINIHSIDSLSLIKGVENEDDEIIISDMSDLDERSTISSTQPVAATSTALPAEKKDKRKPVVKINGVVAGTKRKHETSLAPDLSDPTNTHCRACNLTYNSNSHYRLHCLKFHGISQ